MVLLKKILFSVLAVLAGMLSGVDLMVLGAMLSLSAFLRSFFPKIYQDMTTTNLPNRFCQYSDSTLTWISSLSYGLGMFVGFFTIWVQARVGLKKLLIASTILVSAGGLISLFDPIDFRWYLSGRIISGVGLAVYRQVVPRYLREVPPRECRDWVDTTYESSSTLGSVLGAVFIFSKFGHSNLAVLRWTCVPALLLCIFLLVIYIFLPESPMYLMIRQEIDMARQSLERILDVAQVDEELNLVEEEANVLREVNPLRELFKMSSLPHLCIHVPSFIFRSFMGASTLLLFLPIFLTKTGLGENPSLWASLCTSITSFVIGLISAVLIHHFHFRRRNIILVGFAIVILMQFGLGAILHVYVKPGQDLADSTRIIAILHMCLFAAGSTLVINPMGWLSQSYPSTALSVGSVFSRNTSPTVDFLLAIWFGDLLCSIQAKVFFIFGTISVLGMGFVIKFLPSDLPDVDMIEQWAAHSVWGRFVVNPPAPNAPVANAPVGGGGP